MTVLGGRMDQMSPSAFPIVKFCNFQNQSDPERPCKIQDGSQPRHSWWEWKAMWFFSLGFSLIELSLIPLWLSLDPIKPHMMWENHLTTLVGTVIQGCSQFSLKARVSWGHMGTGNLILEWLKFPQFVDLVALEMFCLLLWSRIMEHRPPTEKWHVGPENPSWFRFGVNVSHRRSPLFGCHIFI